MKIDTRVSDWSTCVDGPWYPSLANGGYVAYRIWSQYDGMRWFQRHEWRCGDGSIETDQWIKGAEGWGSCVHPAEAEGALS